MNYGLPYKGSKSSIAEKIIDAMPSAENFYDLFAGGGAITHCAMLSGKWKNFYMNDIQEGLTAFFRDVVMGKYQDWYTRWVSREDFFALKDSNYLVSICWSFGNNQEDYMYSREVEPYKKAFHFAAVDMDYSLFEAMDIHPPKIDHPLYYERKLRLGRWLKANSEEVKSKYRAWWYKVEYCPQSLQGLKGLQRLQSLQSLESLQRLESLQSLQRLQRLQVSSLDYREVEIKPNSVIYCDIPYRGTDGYVSGNFDHEAFYDWAEQQDNIFISEYDMP